MYEFNWTVLLRAMEGREKKHSGQRNVPILESSNRRDGDLRRCCFCEENVLDGEDPLDNSYSVY